MSAHHPKAASLLSLIAATALLASCGPAAVEPSPEPTTSAPATQSPADPSPSESAPEPAEPSDIDTSDWEVFAAHGVGFELPPNWVVEPENCEDCDAEENPFQQWVVISDRGIPSLGFAADSATSTDGDTGSYERERLELTPLPADLAEPSSLVTEHVTATHPGGEHDQLFVSGVVMDKDLPARAEPDPLLHWFLTTPETGTMMSLRPEFVQDFGLDERDVSADQAADLLASEEYAIAREIMLSVHVEE